MGLRLEEKNETSVAAASSSLFSFRSSSYHDFMARNGRIHQGLCHRVVNLKGREGETEGERAWARNCFPFDDRSQRVKAGRPRNYFLLLLICSSRCLLAGRLLAALLQEASLYYCDCARGLYHV